MCWIFRLSPSSFSKFSKLIPAFKENLTKDHRILSKVIIIVNKHPREDARLRGGSIIKPCAKVSGQNESPNEVTQGSVG